jgi:anti-sigma B factor antagonist
MHMKMTERQVGDVTLLDLTGSLTIDEDAQSLKDKIYSLIQQGRTQVLVNLAKVPYIDSAGLGQLVASYTSLTKANGSMKLLNVNSKNQHLLVITRLVTVFETFDSEAEALASFHHPSEHAVMGSHP